MGGEPEKVGPEVFRGDRLLRPGVVGVAFLADWCPFCRAFAPAFAGLGRSGSWTVLVADVTDDESPLWDRFHLDVVPAIMVFRSGRSTFRRDGVLGVGLGPGDLTALETALRTAGHEPAARVDTRTRPR